jgi:hypothetical protein
MKFKDALKQKRVKQREKGKQPMAKRNPKPEEPKKDINEERWRCFALKMKALNTNTQVQALNEALKRASVEMQALPGRIKEVQQNGQRLEQQFNVAYEQLKVDMECPDGYEVNLETGELFDPSRPPQQPVGN